jgi:inositol-phosphate phosphatase/L-galactose 1-phosphate phosphatase/histidinol-phosphatase
MTRAATPPDSWIDLAHRLADIARPIARRYFRTSLDIDSKADDSPVTIADRSIEAAMREEIERTFPDHGILGEEYGSVRLDGEAVWVLDPIDGTKAFITGMPTFGTLIAACVDGAPVLGVIDQPISEERWIGATGRPSTLNGAEIKASGVTSLADASLYATAPEMFEGDASEARFAALRAAVASTRYGADCYAYGLLALGCVDLVVERMLQPYDYCALVPVIEGAGGRVRDWSGAPLTIESDGHVLAAATPALQEAAAVHLR